MLNLYKTIGELQELRERVAAEREARLRSDPRSPKIHQHLENAQDFIEEAEHALKMMLIIEVGDKT